MRVILIFILFCYVQEISSQSNFLKIRNVENENSEAFCNLIKLSSDKILLTSTGAFEKPSTYWKIINRKIDVNNMVVEWKKFFTPEDLYSVTTNDVFKNNKGNFIFTGSAKHDLSFQLGLDDGNTLIFEMTPKGDILWSSRIGEEPERDWGIRICQVEDGNYCVAGWKYENKESKRQEAILRYISSTGNEIWSKKFVIDDANSIYDETEGVGVIRGTFNSIYFVYHKHAFDEKQIFTIVKLDASSGEIFWEKDYDYGFYSGVVDVKRNRNGNIHISGRVLLENGDCFTPAVWEISQDGYVMDYRDFREDIGCSYGARFTQTKDNGYVFGIRGESYPLMIKLNKNHDIEWTKTYDIEYGMNPKGVVEMDNGDLVMAGREGATDTYSMWIIRTDANGDLISANYDISESDFSISPNPTSNYISISTGKFTEKNIHSELIDNKGRTMLKSNKKRINVSSLSNGIYFIQIYKNNKIVYKEKIIKL